MSQDPSRRLPTSQEIYDRIRWDPGLSAEWITITYEDRDAGEQELPFADFVPGGDIPWHRIQRFRCGDVVVWDRRARTVDLACIRRAPALGVPGTQQPPAPFGSKTACLQHLTRAGREPAWVLVRAAPDYPGFVEEVVLRAGAQGEQGPATLDVEWRSYAMDWMGDATHVHAAYEFATLGLALQEIRRVYGREPAQYTPRPPPLPPGTPLLGEPAALTALFQDAWRRLKADFTADRLLVPGWSVRYRFNGW
ncbi:MAG: DUF504 domain-containing protein [Polyangia bacterium]